MKILIVAHYFSPHPGGIETVALKQAQSLTKLGHDVTVLTSQSDKGTKTLDKMDGFTIERIKSLNFIDNKFGIPYPIISPLYFFKLLKRINSFDLVLIHDVFYMPSHIVGLAAIIKKKPFFLTQHVAMVDHPNRIVMLIQKIVYSTFGNLLFKKAKNITVYNLNVRDFLLKNKIDINKILLTRNGIDTDYFCPIDKKHKIALRKKYDIQLNKPVVLYAGRLVPKKGFDIVYNSQSEEYFTLIVGGGEIPKNMEKTKNVRFFGPATQKQLRDLYHLSDLFVFPSEGEIFTLVMQEAMASGLPVIATKDKGYRGYKLNDDLIAFTSRNADSFKEQIKNILNNNSRIEQMSEYSRELALDYFNWNKNYKIEISIYNRGKKT